MQYYPGFHPGAPDLQLFLWRWSSRTLYVHLCIRRDSTYCLCIYKKNSCIQYWCTHTHIILFIHRDQLLVIFSWLTLGSSSFEIDFTRFEPNTFHTLMITITTLFGQELPVQPPISFFVESRLIIILLCRHDLSKSLRWPFLVRILTLISIVTSAIWPNNDWFCK